MVTRKKNKSTHPGIPDMTPLQLASAGLPPVQIPPRLSKKKPTKAQQIAALQDELRIAQELMILGNRSGGYTTPSDHTQMSPDAGGDTDPATDVEEPETATAGTKRKIPGPVGSTSRLKRSRAIDPFESSSLAHSGATGLVDNWRTKIASPSSTPSPRSLSFNFQTSDRIPMLPSPGSSMTMTSISTSSRLGFEETPLPTFTLPKMVKGSKVYPGVKDLPSHIRLTFRNEFIRFVVRQLANSPLPWINPDVHSLQSAYQLVYPAFPARVRHSDAVHHPTITVLGVLRNHLATKAIAAVQRHLPNVFRQKRLQTVEARAQYIAQLFRLDDDHPIIWREYVVGNVPNHPEVGGYKTTRRGLFQSNPILETVLSYYSSYGIMESPPTEDPGPGQRPLGILALVTAAVERAFRMHATGDFVESGQQFNADLCGPGTARYMDYIVNDLHEKQWNSIFGALTAFSKRTAKEEAMNNGAPEEPRERVPLPPSDPPSPPGDD